MNVLAPDLASSREADVTWTERFVGTWAALVTAIALGVPLFAANPPSLVSVFIFAIPSAWLAATQGVRRGASQGAAVAAMCGYGTCVVSSGFVVGLAVVPIVLVVGLAAGTVVGLGFYVLYLVPAAVGRRLAPSLYLCARSRIVLYTALYTWGLAAIALTLGAVFDTSERARLRDDVDFLWGGGCFALLAIAITLMGVRMRNRTGQWLRAVEAGRAPGYAMADASQFSETQLEQLPRLRRSQSAPGVIVQAAVGHEAPYRSVDPSPVVYVA